MRADAHGAYLAALIGQSRAYAGPATPSGVWLLASSDDDPGAGRTSQLAAHESGHIVEKHYFRVRPSLPAVDRQ
ncbi:hypothetical protein [Solirubrobacter soli]|uniref:hypothetical protein n=1 Tax=Solirubrobacter soli TaxID=363832 RepID=UPI00048613FB|nr:hypothetical protein [Solirubrobacter soli]